MVNLKAMRGHAILVLVLILLIGPYIPLPAASGEVRVEVRAHQFEFIPGRIKAVVGEPLTLIFRSEDVPHGVFIDGQDIDVVLEPGKEVVVAFVPTMAGKFKIRCSVTCGPLHPFMVADLVVESQGINPLFIGSLASLVAVGIGATVYAAKRYPLGSRGGEE